MLDNTMQNHISDLIRNRPFNIAFVTDFLNNFYYDQLLVNLKNVYGDATHFYPSYLQIELLNTINSPIINESSYNFILAPLSEGLGTNLNNKDFLNII